MNGECDNGACGCCGSSKVKRYEAHMLSDPRLPYKFHFNNHSFGSHWHENVEILYFHGDCSIVCEREELEISSGDIAVVNSNALHALSPTEGCEHDCLIVDMAFLKKNGIDLTNISFMPVVCDERAKMLFENVAHEVKLLKCGEKFGEAAVKAAILSLIVYLCRSYSESADGKEVHKEAVRRAIGYIKNHFDEPLTVDAIAETVNLSKYHFCREFHSETGYTVVRYINNIRCVEAQKLLREGKLPVGEIAHKCGFDSLSYFTRTYKTVIGCTPTDSRVEDTDA